MTEMRFDFEWADPLGARGAELRATWARLAIWADGTCVTRVFDEELRTVRDAVYVPLYPLAEWLATHWWNLVFEIPSPERLRDATFVERHSLRAAREGFALPALSFGAEGEAIRLRWYREMLSNHRVEFIEDGLTYVPVDQFRRAADAFVSAVISRLVENGIENTVLQQDWTAITDLNDEEIEFCAATAALGLDPFALSEMNQAAITDAAEKVPAAVRNEFFSVASTDTLVTEANDFSAALLAAKANRSNLRVLSELRAALDQNESEPLQRPWSKGYLAARQLRSTLNLGLVPLKSFDALARALMVREESLKRALIKQPQGTTAVYDSLVAMNANDSPSFAISNRHNLAAQRFHFTRGLFEFLNARDDGPWLVTKSLSDAQKQSRAFAAEFLAPAEAIRDRVSGSAVSADEVDDIARQFGVSSYVIHHQLENHRIAEVLPS